MVWFCLVANPIAVAARIVDDDISEVVESDIIDLLAVRAAVEDKAGA